MRLDYEIISSDPNKVWMCHKLLRVCHNLSCELCSELAKKPVKIRIFHDYPSTHIDDMINDQQSHLVELNDSE